VALLPYYGKEKIKRIKKLLIEIDKVVIRFISY